MSASDVTARGNTASKILACLATIVLVSAISAQAQIGVKATLPGTGTAAATAPTLATSGDFNMGGGNAVALIVTSENSTASTNLGATFAGQTMTLGVYTNQGVQWSGIFYLINPVTTSGAFVITGAVNSTGLGYSAIALGNVGSVGTRAAAANTLNTGLTTLNYATATNGAFVLSAAINNGFNAGSPAPTFSPSNNADITLYPSTIVGSSGHLHTYGDVPTAGAYSEVFTNRANSGQRNAYVTMAFETANLFTNLFWAAGSGVWDINTTANWNDGTGSTTFKELGGVGNPVVFEEALSGASPITVTLNTNVSPISVTLSNSSKTYTISGTGSITGGASLTKTGGGTLALGTANTWSGASALNGGTTVLSVANALATGPITFNGGTLQWATGVSDDITFGRTVTIAASGATLDSGNNTILFSGPIGNGGTGSLTKTGSGSIYLTGTNRYSGNTLVNQGTLALNNIAYISNSPAIIVSSGAVLDVSGAGGIALSSPVSQKLVGIGSVAGSLTVLSNAVISPATNGVVGTFTIAGDVSFAGGSYAFDVSTTARDLLVINGNLSLNSGSSITITAGTLTNGLYKVIQYSGTLVSGVGSSGNIVLSGFSQPGKLATLTETIPGEINLEIADFASDALKWAGSGSTWDTTNSLHWLNGATPWAYTNGSSVRFDETGAAQPTVNLQNVVFPGSVTVSNDSTTYVFADGTGTGGGKISGAASLTKDSAGTLIIQTDNNNAGATVIKAGTLQVGNGGIGNIGTGTVVNDGALIFNQNVNSTVNAISGSGSLTQDGSATVVLAQNNSYRGTTTINQGTLQIGTGGAAGSIGTNAIVDNGTLVFNTTSLTTVPANISGSGSVRLQTPTARTLSALNQYQGSTFIDNGTLTITAPDLIPDGNSVSGSAGPLILDGGAAAGRLDLNGFNETINALGGLGGAVVGVITNSSGAAQTNVLRILGAATTTFNGQIAENPAGAKLSVVLLGFNELRLNGNNTFSGGLFVGDSATVSVGPGGVLGTGGIVLSNSTRLLMRANGSTSVFPGGAVSIPDDSMATISSTSLANGFGGTVSGSASATNQILNGGDGISFNQAATKQFQSLFGTVLVAAGTQLRFSSTSLSVNGGDNATFQVEGTLNTRNGTGNGAGISLGALTGIGVVGGAGNDGNGTYMIGAKNIDTEFSGTIIGVPPRGTSVTKVGTGRLILSGILDYVGTTTISNGVLALAGTAELDDSTTINVRGGVLDVGGIGGVLILGNTNAQTLSGSGTINGSVFANGNSNVTILPGNGIGTLTITNDLTLSTNSLITMELNRTNGLATNDLIVAHTITANGTLTVTNAGPALEGGNTFQLFSVPVSGFTVANLPALTGSMYWTNRLAVNGTIAVVEPTVINPNPPVLGATYSGGVLTLSWPTNAGWTLQTQTNSLAKGLSTNWVDVPGSANITSTNITVVPTVPATFYRLRL